ncbi:MAG: alpha-E domain-containing protein, partial [Baekduiaceae bacterium]
QLETALELLLLDEHNPRSLAYQLGRLMEDLAALPPTAGQRLRADQRLVLETSTALALTDPATMVGDSEGAASRPALDALLGDLHAQLLADADELDREHFTRRLPQHTLGWTGTDGEA